MPQTSPQPSTAQVFVILVILLSPLAAIKGLHGWWTGSGQTERRQWIADRQLDAPIWQIVDPGGYRTTDQYLYSGDCLSRLRGYRARGKHLRATCEVMAR